MGFTKQALRQQEIIKKQYPELELFYHEMMGNFSFTKKDVLLNIESIIRWMCEFPEYQLMHQSNEYSDKEFYLTDFFE